MKHYKDQSGSVYAFEDDGSQDKYIKPGMVVMSQADLDMYRKLPIEKIKQEKRSEIVKSRDTTITSGFPYLGKTIDSDRDSVMSITGAGVAALAAKSAGLPYSVTWTCADDSTIVLDADGVLGMVVTLAMFADAQHAKARPLKDAIKNAKTPDDVGKVVW